MAKIPAIAWRRFAAIVQDATLLAGLSLWFWMMIENIKPGIVSYYWNFTAHWLVFVGLLCFATLLPARRRRDGDDPPRGSFWWILVPGLVSILIIILLSPYRWVAVVFGIMTTIASTALCRIVAVERV